MNLTKMNELGISTIWDLNIAEHYEDTNKLNNISGIK